MPAKEGYGIGKKDKRSLDDIAKKMQGVGGKIPDPKEFQKKLKKLTQ